MFVPFERLTREQECERLLAIAGPDGYETVFRALDVQFKLLHDRAQLLLGICGVLVSTSVVLMTGKIIIRSRVEHEQVIAPLAVIAGVAAVASAALVVGGVLRVRWMTELPGADLRAWIMAALRYRESKTFAYRTSLAALLVSMGMFQAAAILAWVQ